MGGSISKNKNTEQLVNTRAEYFENDEVFERVQALSYRNRLSGIIKSAAKQLKSQKEKTESEFCFIFILANGMTPSVELSQFSTTLYGKMHVLDTKNMDNSKECYYFTDSEFFRHKNIIDGAFLVSNGYMELLNNDKSPRYESVISSKFISRFNGYIYDPIKLEEQGKMFYADTDLPRSDKKSIQDFIVDKYKIERGISFNFPHYSFQSKISDIST
ncbi:MAG: hypothetical protein HRT51_04660 [Colwellia sp.]|nr:hypothetical protein [Colwellia sp.]